MACASTECCSVLLKGVLNGWVALCKRVSEMLEVVEKADRLHVEENLQRSMSASASSPDQPLIEFKDVRSQTS